MASIFEQFRQAQSSLELLEIQEASRPRAAQPLGGRERLVGVLLALVFCLTALPLAIMHPPASVSWLDVCLLIGIYAIAATVELDVSAGFTMPTQIVFVPMLFIVPVAWAPFLVVAGLMVGTLPSILRGAVHPSRLILSAVDAWHTLGPVAVLILADAHSASSATWPILLAALLAQFALDFLIGTARDWLMHGISPTLQVGPLLWVYLIDSMLAPVGFALAVASTSLRFAYLLSLPLLGLLALFALERRSGIANAAELGRAYRGTAMLLGDVVEADDQYTGEHSKGVVELALDVAVDLGLDAAARRRVEFGALLHDVGKVAIPKEIINKPGPLTPDEREIMNTHTIIGQQMLDRVGGVLSEVGVIVRGSHEDYDGTGYPDGLVGENIPLEARIVCACDAFSAMTTNRSYRAARPLDAAFAELRRCSGTQFDPRVVESLIRSCIRRGVQSEYRPDATAAAAAEATSRDARPDTVAARS